MNRVTLLLLLFFIGGCAAANIDLQPRINTLIAAGQFKRAVKTFETQKEAYGPRNELLYYLDKGLCLQIAGQYQESVDAFEKAKTKFEALYTKSLRDIARTWIINDTKAPYRGEDFEHVLVHIFQAINFMALHNRSEALVEARAADGTLKLLNDLYPPGQKNVYREDGFARLLMGILWEGSGNDQDLNDALIAYKKSLEIYQSGVHHAIPPGILSENLLAIEEYLGVAPRDFLTTTAYRTLKDKRQNSEVYLIHYNGLSPIKHPTVIPIPLPGGIISQLAFPKYDNRFYEITHSNFEAQNESGQLFKSKTELAEDIEALAQENLKNRRLRVYAKAVLRPAGKYLLEKGLTQKVRKKNNDLAGIAVGGLSIWYNLYSEQANLRSWQTLPAQIRIARFILPPGTYSFKVKHFGDGESFLEENNLGKLTLKAGDQKFLIVRTVR